MQTRGGFATPSAASGGNNRLILPAKVTARQERNAHRGEVAGTHGIGIARIRYLPRTKEGRAQVVANRRHARQSGRAYSGKSSCAIEETVVENTQPLPAISHTHRVDLDNRDILALEPEVDILEISERAAKQTGGDKQHQRQGDLVSDQEPGKKRSGERRCGRSTRLHALGKFHPRGP